MKRTISYLFCAMAGLLSVSQAHAQSSHDSIYGRDPDFLGNTSKFQINSSDNRFKLAFAGHLQYDNKFTLTPQENADGKKDFKMSIPRARLKLYGSAFDPALTYFFQTQFDKAISFSKESPAGAGRYQAPGLNTLLDYYVNIAANEEYFQIRLGKFRTPFSREQLSSSSQMQFINQSSASEHFRLTEDGHDVGFMIHNGFNHSFEYALAAVSNGLVLRLGYNHNGIDGYDLADFVGGGFRFAIAANGFAYYDYKSTDFKKDLRAGADFIAKYEGFSTNGAFYYRLANDKKELGGGLDLGYLIHHRYEPVLRASWTRKDDKNELQFRGGINHYFFGHHLKTQSYFGPNLKDKKITQWEAGLQIQFAL